MKKLLFATIAVCALGASIPAAQAQVYLGADPGGVGVRVGPFGVGVGPDYWGGPNWRWREHYAYAVPECRAVRTRIVTPSGRVIWRTHRECY